MIFILSFPNSIWERNCQRNSVAARLAMELPQQARSQMEFGNEGARPCD